MERDERLLRKLKRQSHAEALPARAQSSLEHHNWTIPKAPMPQIKPESPACTKYNPSDGAIRAHSSIALMFPKPKKDIFTNVNSSDPGKYDPPVSLLKPKLFVSKLAKDKGGFLDVKRETPDFLIRPKGIGEVAAKGGSMAKSSRFKTIPGTTTCGPMSSEALQRSVLDIPPPSHGAGALITKTPMPRGGGTRHRPSSFASAKFSAFERCEIPDISFAAARFATRSIMADIDTFGTVDDPKLRDDERFLASIREDAYRWKLKSSFA